MAKTLAEPPGSAQSGVGEPEQAVGGFVDGPVAAERDDDVVALVGGLAAQLGRVAAGLSVDRVYLEAALEGIHDEIAQPVGDGAGVGVDDHQHPALGSRGGEAERLTALGRPDSMGARRGAHAMAYTGSRPALPDLDGRPGIVAELGIATSCR